MTKTEICDNIGLMSEKMEDISYLAQDIREEYFEKYDRDSQQDKEAIVWEYNRYASLYRILDNCIFEVAEILAQMDKALITRSKAVKS